MGQKQATTSGNHLDATPDLPSHVSYGPGIPSAPSQQAPVAVLVCHGMGQQVRFETISSVAQSILTVATPVSGQEPPVDVRIFKIDDQYFTRAEISWQDAKEAQHTVHVYEAYWAPLTEGKVTYWDTIKFLIFAGWDGLKYSKLFRPSTFHRWMFGGPFPLTIGRRTYFAILIALLVCLLQVGIIAFVAAELAEFFANLHTASIWCMIEAVPRWIRSLPGMTRSDWLASLWVFLRFLLWIALIAESLAARYFIIQFIGDVAAYISPYKSSKFDEIRQNILKVGFNAGKTIFGFGAARGNVPEYKKVIFVGHSLGSVVAYDTLNALINHDNVSSAPDKRAVIDRTAALITFGSPLDKTAFIFRMQPGNKEDWIREHLAASAQPLILSYPDYRPGTFRWINLWSGWDIISGELEYYDAVPEDHPLHVQNIPDPQARGLKAHVQYWNNDLFRSTLHQECVRYH